GMAVDSNVLIFERMREEFALGKSIRSGVEGGYDKAFWTIVDSQVTTLITALALFLFGTGPIKGFAVTLSFGVTFNLFTTLFGTRLAYDYLYNKRALKKLTFLKFFNKPNLDYMSIRKITFTISTLLALLGMFAFVQILRGHGNLGVDFAGGSMLEYQASAPFQLKEARKAFAKHKLNDIQLQKVENKNQLIIKLKKSTKTVENLDTEVTKILNSEIKGQHFKIISETEIGSSVSSALRDKAVEAIFISLLGIIIYLALRFDIRFGLAGVIAIFHDVLVVIGICYIMNVEMTLLIVTSLLTLAGYSINDSVIVFDRIRENIKHQGNEKNLFALINRSTNEMLSRTIVTSLTTLLSLVALFLLGGVVIHEFAFTLIIGIIVGTYSSIFIASPLLSIWSKEKQ
ncbi:MAG TPA: protein translocase subunit SecF, partial [Desulfobacterales bacterium]|nr:protein translocase subunit SecF [Desulfobacterales bacterium]